MDIKEGAGREESQYDQNFLNWLNKWGNRILWLVLIVLGLYLGNQYLGKWQRAGVDKAYAELNEVGIIDPTPEAFLAVATKHGDTRGIGHMARLSAGDGYLNAVRRGLVLGAVPSPDGTLLSQDDVLSEDDRTFYLEQAQTQYQTVYDDTSEKPDLALHAIGAGFGLASVAETRGELDAAAEWFTKVETLASDLGYIDVVEHAGEMREALADLELNPNLYSNSDLPEPPVQETEPDFSDLDLEQLLRDAQAEIGPTLEGVGDGDATGEDGGEESSTEETDDGSGDGNDSGEAGGEDGSGDDQPGGDGG